MIVNIPVILRKLVNNQESLTAEGNTIADVLAFLQLHHPLLFDRICDQNGIRRFVNVYVNQEDIRFLDDGNTTVQQTDTISILPAIAGG